MMYMQYTYYMPKSVSKQLHCILSLSLFLHYLLKEFSRARV